MKEEIKIPTSRNGKATFTAIVESAIDLFYKQGFHKTTIGNITSQAKIGAGTFYLYFPNKLALYKYILFELHHEIRKAISEKVALVEGRYEKERVGMETFIHYAVDHPYSYNIIWESLYIDKHIFMDYYDGFAKRYENGLDKSIKSGEMHDVDTELVSYILMGVANFIGLKVLLDLGKNNEDVTEITNKVMKIIKTGIFK